ncbi:MAG: UDP-3-O-(3-hydroxymyristoyl)glucosamine N-acyltransferase [Flavobacteriales bacterium]
MNFTAQQIAELIKGKLEGDASCTVQGFNGLDEATEGELTFIESEKYLDSLAQTKATIVLVRQDLDISSCKNLPAIIRVEQPRMALAKLLWKYKSISENYAGVSEKAVIHDSAKIGADAYIGVAIIKENTAIGRNALIHDGVVIEEGVTIGENTVIHSGAKIMRNCIVGSNCTIQPNVIIGGDGFGFVPNSDNNYFKIPHIGNVILEDHVEIGANTCVDRATMGSTIIRKGVKLDNLIQVAHNVEIGENTVIAAQTGIAGSAVIGKNCLIGGQVGIVGHITIADEVKIAAQSGIGHSIKEKGAVMQGSPAFKIRDYKMSYVGFRKLPELMKQIDALSKELEQLKSSKL